MDPFPAICPQTRAYGPGGRMSIESFAAMFEQGTETVGLPLTLGWDRIHVLDADLILAHQRESRGVRSFALPLEAWGDHPDPNELAEGMLWRYDPSSPVSMGSGGAYVSLTVNLLSALP